MIRTETSPSPLRPDLAVQGAPSPRGALTDALPRLPDRIARLESSPTTCGGAGTRSLARCSKRSIRPCGTIPSTTPSSCCTRFHRTAWPRRPRIRRSSSATTPCSTTSTRCWQPATPGASTPSRSWRTSASRTSRRSSASTSSLPIYCGGLGVLAGDHLKEAQRSRHPPGRRSACSTAQATSSQRISSSRLAAGAYSTPTWSHAADPTRARRRTASRCMVSSRVRTPGVRCKVGVCEVASAAAGCCLLDTDLESNARVGPRHSGAALRRRSTARGSAGDPARHRRRPAAARAGHRADGLHANEGHAAFMCWSGCASSWPPASPSTRRSQRVRASRPSSRRTPRWPPGHDCFRLVPGEDYFGGYWPRSRARSTTASSRWAQHGEPNDLQHDGVLRCAPSRHATASASCTARSRGGCGSRLARSQTDDEVPITHVTNGVHVRRWLAAQHAHAASTATSASTGPSGRDEPAFWEGLADVRDDELWERIHRP